LLPTAAFKPREAPEFVGQVRLDDGGDGEEGFASALPLDELEAMDEFSADEALISRVNDVLSLFVGTKNHHNFTSGLKADDASANRYIMSFHVSGDILFDDLEG
jgi:tRNA U38,U39,U40 pseudouridine synthase TruA